MCLSLCPEYSSCPLLFCSNMSFSTALLCAISNAMISNIYIVPPPRLALYLVHCLCMLVVHRLNVDVSPLVMCTVFKSFDSKISTNSQTTPFQTNLLIPAALSLLSHNHSSHYGLITTTPIAPSYTNNTMEPYFDYGSTYRSKSPFIVAYEDSPPFNTTAQSARRPSPPLHTKPHRSSEHPSLVNSHSARKPHHKRVASIKSFVNWFHRDALASSPPPLFETQIVERGRSATTHYHKSHKYRQLQRESLSPPLQRDSTRNVPGLPRESKSLQRQSLSRRTGIRSRAAERPTLHQIYRDRELMLSPLREYTLCRVQSLSPSLCMCLGVHCTVRR